MTLAVIAACGGTRAHAQAPGEFTGGEGRAATVLLDGDGKTVHAAWRAPGTPAGEQVKYCRLLEGATGCAAGSTLTLTTDTQTTRFTPYVLRVGNKLVVVSSTSSTPSAYAYVSTDNGQSFPQRIDLGPQDIQGTPAAGPGDAISALAQRDDGTNDIIYTRRPLDGGGQPADGPVAKKFITHGNRQMALLPDGRPIALTGTGSSTYYSFPSSASDPASWPGDGTADTTPSGDDGVASTGANQLWVRLTVTSPRLGPALRRWNGTGFDAPVLPPFNSAQGSALGIDGQGGLHLAWTRLRAGTGGPTAVFDTCYQHGSADGRTWSSPVTLASDGLKDDNLSIVASGPFKGRIVGQPITGKAPRTVPLDTTPRTPNTCGTAPSVKTEAAAATGPTTAGLAGTVDPSLQATTVHFEWGEGSTLTNTTPAKPQPAAGAAGDAIGGLKPSTLYSVRVVATNASGTTAGDRVSFTTPAAPKIEPPKADPPKLVKTKIFARFPSNRSCRSKRAFKVTIRKTAGVTYTSAKITVNGKTKTTVKGPKVTLPISLKGLPKGTYTIKVTLKTADGRTTTFTRRYKTCAPRKKKG